MKKVIVSLVCVTMLVMSLRAGDKLRTGGKLLNYVPTGIDGIVSVNLKQIIDMPLFLEKRAKDPEVKKQWAKFEQQLQNLGLTVNDLPSQVMIFFSQKKPQLNGAVMRTPISEKRFVAILKKEQLKRPNLYSTKQIDGKTVYLLTQKLLDDVNLPQKPQNNKEGAVTFLQPDVALICEANGIDTILKATKNNSQVVERLLGKSDHVNRNAPIWLIFRNRNVAPKAQPGARPSMTDGITGVSLSLDFTGAKQRDLGLNAQVTCRDSNTATTLGMQIKGMVMMLSTMAFKDNPALGNEVSQVIKVNNNNNNVAIKIDVSEQLGGKIQKYIAEQKKLRQQKRMARKQRGNGNVQLKMAK